MSTPYLDVILTKVRQLESEQRLYYERVVTSIDTVPAFSNQQNVAFLILAYSLDELPELLPTAMPEQNFLTHLAKFLFENRMDFSRQLYSEEFARHPSRVAREMAQGFTARIATDLLEQYAAGTLETGEARSYSFRWPYYDDGAFPYEELSDEDEED